MSSGGSFNYTSIFITSMFIILFCNLVYYSSYGNLAMLEISVFSLNVLTTFLPAIIAVVLASGIKVLNTGISDVAVKLILGVGALINLLFQFNIFGLPVGLGLLTNIYDIFAAGDFFGLSIFVTSILAFVTFFSGIMILVGGSE